MEQLIDYLFSYDFKINFMRRYDKDWSYKPRVTRFQESIDKLIGFYTCVPVFYSKVDSNLDNRSKVSSACDVAIRNLTSWRAEFPLKVLEDVRCPTG